MTQMQTPNTALNQDLKFKFFSALIELQKYSPNDNVDSFYTYRGKIEEYNIDEMLTYLEEELK